MKKLILFLLLCSLAHADDEQAPALIYDSSGNSLSSVSGSLNSNLNAIGGTPVSFGQQLMSLSLPVAIASNQTGINAFLDKNVTGTISALNGTVTITNAGMASVIITATGTWSANLAFQCFDGTNWINASALTIPAGGITTSLSANGSADINSGGCSQIRILANSYSSGTANIFMNAGAGPSVLEVYNDSGNPLIVALPTGASTSALQTTGNASLASIDLGIPAGLGQTTMSASMPVVIASDQSRILVNNKAAQTPNSATNVSIGVASTSVLASNTSRTGAVFMNLSTATISFGLTGAAVLNSGVTLYPGGVWTMDEFTFTTNAITAIAGTAASSLAVQEFQ